MKPADRFERMIRQGAAQPHGTRRRYLSGCRCVPCRAANSNYQVGLDARKRAGEPAGLVDTAAACEHIRALSKSGIGQLSIAAAASVGRTVIREILAGRQTRIRAATSARILAVTTDARADKSLIDAAPTWAILDELIERGYTRGQLAAWLGSKARTPALQVGRTQVTARNALRVAQLAAAIDAGRMRRQ